MDLEGLSTQEQEAFTLYREKYSLQHPPPERGATAALGWQFYLLLLTSLASVVLASLRTADMFYRAAYLGGNRPLALAEAVAVLLAIEGGIVVYSAIRAQAKGNYGLTKLLFGIVVMVLISTFAGLGQSLNLIENISPQIKLYFEYALTLVIGVGASVVAWIGGEVLGGQIALVGSKQEKMDETFASDLRGWEESLLRSWNASPERKIVRKDIVQAVPVSTAPSTAVQDGYKTDEVYDWLTWQNNGWRTESDVPTARQIEKSMNNIPVSSAQRGRARWIRENL